MSSANTKEKHPSLVPELDLTTPKKRPDKQPRTIRSVHLLNPNTLTLLISHSAPINYCWLKTYYFEIE